MIELATVPGGKAAKKGPVLQPDELHKLILQSLDDDQAQEVVSIPLQGKSSIADYMVVASGRSSRQVASMAQKLAERIKQEGYGSARIEGLPSNLAPELKRDLPFLPGRVGLVTAPEQAAARAWLIERTQPTRASVEKVFVNVNPQSTLLLGQARGAALAALLAADVDVAEYTALQMKKAMVGHGHARKEQVQAMVARLLNLATAPGTDASDALGLAITHAHAGASLAAMRAATPLARRQHAQYRKGRVY